MRRCQFGRDRYQEINALSLTHTEGDISEHAPLSNLR